MILLKTFTIPTILRFGIIIVWCIFWMYQSYFWMNSSEAILKHSDSPILTSSTSTISCSWNILLLSFYRHLHFICIFPFPVFQFGFSSFIHYIYFIVSLNYLSSYNSFSLFVFLNFFEHIIIIFLSHLIKISCN